MAQNGQEDIGVWSEDHRRSGSRALTEEECAEVSRLGAHGRLRGALMLLPIPFLFLTCVRALPLLADLKQAWILLTVFVLGVLLGLTPLLLLKARDRLREGRELGRDARSGFVELFGRVTVEESETFGGAARSGGQSVLGKARCFEVLPNSGLVWRVDGIRVSGWQHARRAAAADPPPYAAIAAEWVEPIAGVGDGAVHLGHRELSTAEQKELKRHLRRLTVRPLGLALLLCTWLGLVLGLGSQAGHGPDPEASPTFLLLMGTTGVSLFSLFRSWRLGQKLGRDLSFGRVVIARTRVSDAEEISALPKLTPPEEFLPASGALWTRSGKPAAWRLKS